jgi:hypothetical protein
MPHFVDRTMGHTFTVSVNPMKDIVWQIYNLADSSKVYVSDKTAGSAKQVHTITVAANDLPAANTEYLLRVWHAGSGGENFSCEMELKTL